MVVIVFGFLLGVWHELSMHQPCPPVLGHLNAQYSAYTTGVVTYLAYA